MQDPPWGYFSHLWSYSLNFFCLKALGKNEKWRHFGAHAQWWSPWRRKNVENGHLAPSNLTFLLERFSKPNFGSIRRFRAMTGLEIENWIEKCGRTVRKFRSTRPRTESNFRFGWTSCWSQNLHTEVRSLLCQVFDSFSLVTSSSSHHASHSHLRGFIRSLTRPNWSFHSTGLTMNFTSAGDFRQLGSWPSSVNEWARSVGHGITSDRRLGRRSPPDLHSLTKNTSLGHRDRDFLQLDVPAPEQQRWACNRMVDRISVCWT